jgi:hypothetical protein
MANANATGQTFSWSVNMRDTSSLQIPYYQWQAAEESSQTCEPYRCVYWPGTSGTISQQESIFNIPGMGTFKLHHQNIEYAYGYLENTGGNLIAYTDPDSNENLCAASGDTMFNYKGFDSLSGIQDASEYNFDKRNKVRFCTKTGSGISASNLMLMRNPVTERYAVLKFVEITDTDPDPYITVANIELQYWVGEAGVINFTHAPE